MIKIVIGLHILAVIAPSLGFIRLLSRAHKQVRAVEKLVKDRGTVSATFVEFNEEYEDITVKPRAERNDLLWDTCLVAGGLVAGAIASILSLLFL